MDYPRSLVGIIGVGVYLVGRVIVIGYGKCIRDDQEFHIHLYIFLLYPSGSQLGTFDFMFDTYVHLYTTYIPIYIS